MQEATRTLIDPDAKQAYDEKNRGKRKGEVNVPFSRLPGALILLHEVGELEVVLDVGASFLNANAIPRLTKVGLHPRSIAAACIALSCVADSDACALLCYELTLQLHSVLVGAFGVFDRHRRSMWSRRHPFQLHPLPPPRDGEVMAVVPVQDVALVVALAHCDFASGVLEGGGECAAEDAYEEMEMALRTLTKYQLAPDIRVSDRGISLCCAVPDALPLRRLCSALFGMHGVRNG